jgi:TIR domain
MAPKKGSKNKARDERWDRLVADMSALMNEREKSYRNAFREVVELHRSSTPLQKAEGVLEFWAHRLEQWGDHEAVVYLVSRGRDASQFSNNILANWQTAERAALDRLAKGFSAGSNLDPFEILSRFWSFYDSQELTIDATLLRTVEWCKIHSFDRWWEKLGKEIKESSYSGGAHPLALFDFARADRAIRTMGDGLKIALDAAETGSGIRKDPWLPSPVETRMESGTAVLTAASIVFAHKRIVKEAKTSELIARGIDALRKSFNHEIGAWPRFSNDDSKMSVSATAMALHALRLASIEDWSHFAAPAANWLRSQQDEDGYWSENGSPDVVWLTVLVLDALELASGGTKVTFDMGTSTLGAPLVFVAYQHRDNQFLRQLEDHLGALIHTGKIEFFDDRKILAGTEWDPAVRAKLDSAKVIVPLISSHFLSSKYIQTVELPNAIARHRNGSATVVPVLLDHCDWESLEHNGFALSQLNFLPKDESNDLKPISELRGPKRAAAFTQIAQRIRKCIEDLAREAS